MDRNIFGAIVGAECGVGFALIKLAINAGKLPPEEAQFNKRNCGWARNYDIYDVTPGGGKAIVQCRETRVTKHYNSPQKSYFLISKKGRGVVVTELVKEKPLIVRRAKQATRPGDLIHSLSAAKRKEIADAAVRAARANGLIKGNSSGRREHARAI